jgi:hypothetical protein
MAGVRSLCGARTPRCCRSRQASSTVAGALAAWTSRDRATSGYPELPAGDGLDADWVAGVEASLPAVRTIAVRNDRIGDLRALLRRSRAS